MCKVMELVEANREIARLQSKVDELQAQLIMPLPPESQVYIDANELSRILQPYGIVMSGTTSDFGYLLMTKEEANRFVAWYKENAPIKPAEYTQDDLDCDDFAWIMRAYALKWSNGTHLWGYTESESADPNYPFPSHGFCFLVIDDKTVWFADALGLAAPDDEINEAYPVKCYMAKC